MHQNRGEGENGKEQKSIELYLECPLNRVVIIDEHFPNGLC